MIITVVSEENNNILIRMIIIVVISTVQYFTDAGEHTPLYKINTSVHIKPEQNNI